MAIESYPVWTFPPNWTSDVSETWEWRTDILTSDSGAEQRRTMRLFPRLSFEFKIAASGAIRSYADQFLAAHGSKKIYMPLWYDVMLLSAAVLQGSDDIILTVDGSGVVEGMILCLFNGDPLVYELVEVQSIVNQDIDLVSALAKNWPAGTRVFPVKPGRLLEQPGFNMRSDRISTSDVQFLATDKPLMSEAFLYDYSVVRTNADIHYIYEGFPVLTTQPEFITDPNMTYERQVDVLDNDISLPVWSDKAGRSFSTVEIGRYIRGRAEYQKFLRFIRVLRGRAVPIWVPTFAEDLVLTADVPAGRTRIDVQFIGYTRTGGIKPDRQYIMIETVDTRYFLKITS
jgi:hypothetical protein